MLAYIGRRILQMIPVFIGITIILFILRSPAIVPGDPSRMLVGERAVSDALREQVIKENALDKPLYRAVLALSDAPGAG